MALIDFNSRFGNYTSVDSAVRAISNPSTGQPFSLYDVSDEVLQQVLTTIGTWQVFSNYVEMSKGYSVVIRRASYRDVFNTAVQQVDPRIALILGAAKDKNTNKHLFQTDSTDPTVTLNRVFTFMFGGVRPGGPGDVGASAPNFTDSTSEYDNSYYYSDLFTNGIARVSAAMTAAILIGRLSQVAEQAEHAKHIESQCLDDLSRIIETYSISAAVDTGTTANVEEEERANVAFYFRPGVVRVGEGEALVCGYYSVMSRRFREIRYEAENEDLLVNVGQIASDIADLINSDYTIVPTTTGDPSLAGDVRNTESPFIATASQSGQVKAGQRLITLSVYPRHIVERVISQVLNVRIYVDQVVTQRGPVYPGNLSSSTSSQNPSILLSLNPEAARALQIRIDNQAQPPNAIPDELPDASDVPEIVDNDLTADGEIITPLPFWGVNSDSLAQTNYNGVLITLRSDTVKAVASTSSSTTPVKTVKLQDSKPVALYIRKKPGVAAPSSASVKLRLNPLLNFGEISPPSTIDRDPASVPDNIVTVEAVPNSQSEVTQVELATAIIDALNMFQRETRVAGVLFRNDDPYASNAAQEPPVSAIELICWSVFSQQAYSILDILEIPSQFEMAAGAVTTHWEEQKIGVYSAPTTGNYFSFQTKWGPAPRSIKVDNRVEEFASGAVTDGVGPKALPQFARSRIPINYLLIKEEHEAAQQ